MNDKFYPKIGDEVWACAYTPELKVVAAINSHSIITEDGYICFTSRTDRNVFSTEVSAMRACLDKISRDLEKVESINFHHLRRIIRDEKVNHVSQYLEYFSKNQLRQIKESIEIITKICEFHDYRLVEINKAIELRFGVDDVMNI